MFIFTVQATQKKYLGIFLFLCLYFSSFSLPQAHASTLSTASDTLSTSRPSASTPLSADAGAGVGNIAIYNNGSTFLASDSAHFWGNTQESVIVATVSANKQTLFFTGTTANAHTNGTVIATAITAMHTVSFQTVSSIPSTGSIVIAFPGSISSDTNPASPSASTFMPNGLSSANIKTNQPNLSCSLNAYSAGSSPTITCNNSTSSINGGSTVTILIGCSSSSGSSCTAQAPTLINPTKLSTAGTADTRSISLATYDSTNGTGNQLDTATIKAGNVESVNIVGHIDSTFSFTITGVADNFALTSVCTSNPDTTNTSFPTTSTDVNLGTLLSTSINHAAQKMVVTSNAGSGYVITATSSGHFINPANGIFFSDAQGTPTNNDSPAPTTLGTGSNKFGIHPCDTASKVSTGTWGTSSPNYANPSPSFYYTLVNSGSAPASNGDTIYIEYSASPGSSTAPGDYHAVLTYVASVVF